MKRAVFIVAAVLLAPGLCGAQTELPDNAADARTLRDNALAWSQGVENPDDEDVDLSDLAAVADFLEGQAWPDPLNDERYNGWWHALQSDRPFHELSLGLKWLSQSFVAERPAFVEQAEAAGWRWADAKAIHSMADDPDLRHELIEFDRWADEWERLLIDSGYREQIVDMGDTNAAWIVPRNVGSDRDVLRCLLWWIDRELSRGEWDRAKEIMGAFVVYSRATHVTVGSIGMNDLFGRFIGPTTDNALVGALVPHIDSMPDEQLAWLSLFVDQFATQHYLVPTLSKHHERLRLWEEAASPEWFHFEYLPEKIVRRMIAARDEVKPMLNAIANLEFALKRAIVDGNHDTAHRAQTELDALTFQGSAFLEAMDDDEINKSNPSEALMTILSFWNGANEVSPLRPTLARTRAFKIVIALHRHKLANGEWPKSLDALVPAFLDELPKDPHDPERGSIRYRVNEDGSFMLWSVGPDGVDNGGKADPEKATTIGDGFDLVLWPR